MPTHSKPSHSQPSFLERIVFRLCLGLCKYLPAPEVGKLVQALRMHFAGADPAIGRYAMDCNNPQALCFLLDIFPMLQERLMRYPRGSVVKFLDLGPAFGASAGLLADMYRSDFLGPKLQIDAMDIVDDRKQFIEMNYPAIQFMKASIDTISDDAQWDVIYCSNAIEHLDDPRAFLESIMRHTRGYAFILAPYNEAPPLSLDHRHQINEATFAGFDVESISLINTAAWPATADGVERQQILAVLKPSR